MDTDNRYLYPSGIDVRVELLKNGVCMIGYRWADFISPPEVRILITPPPGDHSTYDYYMWLIVLQNEYSSYVWSMALPGVRHTIAELAEILRVEDDHTQGGP